MQRVSSRFRGNSNRAQDVLASVSQWEREAIGERIFRNVGDREDIVDMDDEPAYGPKHVLTFRDAVLQGLLVDYKLVTFETTKAEMRDGIANHAYVIPAGFYQDKATAYDQFAAALGLLRAMAQHQIQHVITFHRTVKRAAVFTKLLQHVYDTVPGLNAELPDLYLGHVNGDTPVSDRMDTIDAAVCNGYSVVTNARWD